MMAKNYEVGYGKPPFSTRFEKGVCPNPSGRGRKVKNSQLSQIEHILYKPADLNGSHDRKKLTHAEIVVKKLIISALRGNALDAQQLLKLYKHTSASTNERLLIRVEGGFPGIFD